MKLHKKILTVGAALLALTLVACHDDYESDFKITSTSVDSGAALPSEFSCEAKAFTDGISPGLNWSGAPEGTKSYVIVFKDLSLLGVAPQYAFHWVMWNIPASATSLPQELAAGDGTGDLAGAKQLSGAPGAPAQYFGPCPSWQSVCPIDPPARSNDTYAFTIYAMGDEKVTLPAFDADADDNDFATQIHASDVYFAKMALATAELKITSDAAPGSEEQASFTLDTPDGEVTISLCPTEEAAE